MIHKTMPVVLSVLLSTFALSAGAEGPRGETASGDGAAHHKMMHGKSGHHFEKMAEKLDLTAEQREQLKVLKSEYREKVEPVRERKKELMHGLHERGIATLQPADIEEYSRQMGEIHAAKSRARLEMKVGFHRLLTPEQQKKLKALHEQRREKYHQKKR